MKDEKFLIILVLGICFVFLGCQNGEAINNKSRLVKSAPNEQISVKNNDFKNFTYPLTKRQELDEKTFTLKDGKKASNSDKSNGATFGKIEFDDVTNDGKEEAIISISPITGGNCSCDMIYVYSLKNEIPIYETVEQNSNAFSSLWLKRVE